MPSRVFPRPSPDAQSGPCELAGVRRKLAPCLYEREEALCELADARSALAQVLFDVAGSWRDPSERASEERDVLDERRALVSE
jgi:hypothetical protein